MALKDSRSHVAFIEPLLDVAWKHGIDVQFVPGDRLLDPTGQPLAGVAYLTQKKILLRETEPSNQTVEVLAHELGHALNADLHRIIGEQAREVFAQAVACFVLTEIGVDRTEVTHTFIRYMVFLGLTPETSKALLDAFELPIQATVQAIMEASRIPAIMAARRMEQ